MRFFRRGELDSSPTENRFISREWAFALDFSSPALKRMIRVGLLFRNAEALLPSAKAQGSHPTRGEDPRRRQPTCVAPTVPDIRLFSEHDQDALTLCSEGMSHGFLCRLNQ
jgi:hypothetical protein